MNEVIAQVDITPITAAQAEQMSPQAHQKILAKEKGLIQASFYEEDYLRLQASYLAAMNYYLCSAGGLDEYQKLLDANEFTFPHTETNVYQEVGSFGRNNIYIRSNVYVEYLPEDDIQLLREARHGDALAMTDKLLDMVKRTLVNVVSVRYDDSGSTFDAVYDIGAFSTNTAPNQNLVLEIFCEPEFDSDGNLVNEAAEEGKADTVQTLKQVMEQDLSERLGIGVTVFIRF